MIAHSKPNGPNSATIGFADLVVVELDRIHQLPGGKRIVKFHEVDGDRTWTVKLVAPTIKNVFRVPHSREPGSRPGDLAWFARLCPQE